MRDMQILMCGNRDVFRGVLLCTLSIVKYSRDKITLFLGTMDLSDVDPRYRPITEEDAETVRGVLKSTNPDSDVVILDFGEYFRDELINSKNLGTSYTPYCMIRLFADKAEKIGDKLLYLDTDIMLKGDVGELYDINVDGYHLAGSRDFFGKFFFSPRYTSHTYIHRTNVRLLSHLTFLPFLLEKKLKGMTAFFHPRPLPKSTYPRQK
jgi:lipopolysaccharide biosynthesis glycosyltransferase